MEQASFNFDEPLSIQERFEAFHKRHPEVFEYLVAVCIDLRLRGRTHYGVKSLFERARWHFQVERDLGEEFKLNNNYHSRYARLIMASHPGQFEDFFELRELKTP